MASFTRASYSKQSLRDERTASSHRHHAPGKKPMGLKRVAGSALSITLGVTLVYTGLHYIPTLLRPSQVIDTIATPEKKSALEMDRERLKRFGIYAQSFFMRRTYLRSGQSITVHYTLPKGAILDLDIQQCRRIFMIEVFHCQAMSAQSVRVENKTDGRRTLKFSEPGFYHFDETVTLRVPDEDYKLVWVRS